MGEMTAEGCDPPMGGADGGFVPGDKFHLLPPTVFAPPNGDKQWLASEVHFGGKPLDMVGAIVTELRDLSGNSSFMIGAISGVHHAQFKMLFPKAFEDYFKSF